MNQLRFDWYEDMLLDVFEPNSCLLTKKKSHEKQEKQQSKKQAKEQQAKRQTSLRKSKSRRYQALRADQIAHNFMRSIRL